MRTTISLVACLFFSALPTASASIPQALSYLPEGSQTALYVQSLSTNKTYQALNDTALVPPASTQKLITALAATIAFPADFRFTTTIEQYKNDLTFRFSGDPSLMHKDIKKLIRKAKKSGLRTISGNIWLDDSAFNGYERAVGWPWDILGVCYSAPSSAISLNQNCVQAALYTQKNGKTRVNVPSHQSIFVTTNVRTVSKSEKKQQFCDLELSTTPFNNYQLSGCLVERNKPLPLNFAIQDTFLYSQEVIRKELKAQGISFKGQVVKGKPQAQGKVLAQHHSAPLPKLIDTMLKKSDNLIADNLTKALGSYYYQQPGSFSNGTAAIKDILKQKANINLSNSRLVDGSGLSRNNRITAKQLTDVLNYIYKNDDQLKLLRHLPTAGMNGTLQYRRSMRIDPVKGNITAKSGSLYGTYNMAGFATTSAGEPLLFVQLISNYHPEPKKEGAPVTPPGIELFEKHFYQDLLSSNLSSN